MQPKDYAEPTELERPSWHFRAVVQPLVSSPVRVHPSSHRAVRELQQPHGVLLVWVLELEQVLAPHQ